MLRRDIDELEIGDWCFFDSPAKENPSHVFKDSYIALRFLEGDRGLAILPIANNECKTPQTLQVYNSYGQKCWLWNGSKEAPTLEPSILHWGDGNNQPASWHGWLRNGQLINT